MATKPAAPRDRAAVIYRVVTALAFAATVAMLFLPAGARPPGF